jgi:hypothetical protein
VDQIFQIQVTVRDQTSVATAAADVVVQPRVLVVPDGLLLFTSSGSTNSVLYTCRFDGTELKALYTPFGPGDSDSRLSSPSLSHDGTRVAAGSDRDGPGLKLFSAAGGSDAGPLFEVIPAPAGQAVNSPVFDATGTTVYCWLTPENKVYTSDSGGLSPIDGIPGPVAGVSQDNKMLLVTEGAEARLRNNEPPFAQVSGASFDGFFGICVLKDEIFLGLGDPATGFDLYKCPIGGPYATPALVFSGLPGGSTVGGNGRLAFYPVNDANPRIVQTGVHRRMIDNQNGFFGPIASFHELRASK